MGVVTLLERARAQGLRLQVKGEHIEVQGQRTAEAEGIVEELRRQKAEVLAALRLPLSEYAAHLPGVPVLRFSLRETSDAEGDVAFLRRIVETLRDYPGGNRIICTIRGLPTCPHEEHPLSECGESCSHVVEWRALVTPALRRRVAELLRQRAVKAPGAWAKACLGRSGVRPLTGRSSTPHPGAMPTGRHQAGDCRGSYPSLPGQPRAGNGGRATPAQGGAPIEGLAPLAEEAGE